MNKSQLLEALKTQRFHWDQLLNLVDETRMDEPGVAGYWSVKDIISHITAYERWLVEWLTAATKNTLPAESPLDDADIQRRNRRVYESTRSLSVEEVRTAARQNFEALLVAIEILPDPYFDDPQSAEWFMKPYWSKMRTISEAVLNLSAGHYEEHLPAVQAWVMKSKEN